ncbi:MAG: hypothetical protein AAGC55_33480, partial [Myxococcota bacterium]
MPEISPTTAAKQAVTRTVVSSVRSHSDELAQRIGTILFPDGAPAAVDLGALYRAVAAALERTYLRVEHADREVARELGEDRQARGERDHQAEAMRDTLVRLRGLVAGAHGPEAVDAVGLSGAIPTRTEALVPFARNTADKLVTLSAPAPALSFTTLNLDAAAAALRQQAERLDRALSELARDRRETQAAQDAHHRANDAWQRDYSALARIIESSFLLAGMEHQAARVRPTSRRRAGRPEPADVVALAADA